MQSSPAQRLMSRRTRTQFPTSMVLLKPDLVAENVKANLEAKRKKIKTHYDKRAPATELPPLQVGQQVLVKTAANYWVFGYLYL